MSIDASADEGRRLSGSSTPEVLAKEGVLFAPTGVEPRALTGELPALTGEQPALTGELPALTGEQPALTGEMPALTGEQPAPREKPSTPDASAGPSTARPAPLRPAEGSALRPRLSTRSWRERLGAQLLVGDAVALATAMTLSGALAGSGLLGGHPDRPWAWAVGLGCAWLLALSAAGSRSLRLLGAGREEFTRLIRTSVGLFGVLAILTVVLAVPGVRWVFALALPTGLGLLLVHRALARRALTRSRRRDGAFSARVALVGDQDVVRHIDTVLRAEPSAGYVPQLAIMPDPALEEATALAPETTGELPLPAEATGDAAADVVEVLDRHPEIDAIAVSGARMRPSEMRRLGWLLHDRGISMIMAEALTDVAGPRIEAEPVGGTSLIHVSAPSLTGGKAVAKRALDFIGSGLGLMVLSPLFLVIAIAVALDSRGPVFFHQERVGRYGESIRMHKFRSMVADAEERLAHLSSEGAGNDVLFKMQDDPRTTRVGRFLRRYSLDELPQLWNVLVGDMSLVGPRPPLPSEVELYEPDAMRRLDVPPGITGLWQVSGRSDLSWDDSVRLDLYYVENWSLAADLLILLRTVAVVLRPAGAY